MIAEAEQKALVAIQERLAAERNACADEEERARIEQELATTTRAREQAAREARVANEARAAAEKLMLEKAAEQAAMQRAAAEAAEARAREAVELARLEHARAAAEQQALAAVRDKVRAAEAELAEAEKRAAAEREAADLARQREATEIEARAEQEKRVKVEWRALEAARKRKEADALATEKARMLRTKCRQEHERSQEAARELAEHMTQRLAQFAGWRESAQALLAQLPDSVVKPALIRRPLAVLFGGAAFVAGVAGTFSFAVQNPRTTQEVAQIVGLAVVPQAESMPVTAAAVSAVPMYSKLQISYELANQPQADLTVVKATGEKFVKE